MRSQLPLLSLVAVLWIGGRAGASDFDVIISEIHYNPLSDLPQDEFVELHNRGPAAVALGGWIFSEGLTFEFPSGLVLQPKSFLVVSPDAAHTKARFGISNVVGNYSGRLDNDGEIIAIQNAAGDTVSRVHYRDGADWPSRPDGLGPSLEIIDPRAQPDIAKSWACSLFIDGSPGRENARGGAAEAGKILVGAQDVWRYFKGTEPPSSPAGAWKDRTFSDAEWESGPGGFGYGDSLTYATKLADMRGAYSTVFLRGRFSLTAAEVQDLQAGSLELTLTTRYDDGFVAYLNGVEVARENAGTPGDLLPFDAIADGPLNTQSYASLRSFAASLVTGTNVMAVQGLNRGTDSSDFLIEAELALAAAAPSGSEESAAVVINEVKPSETGSPGFIEIFNSGSEPFALAGHGILDSAGNRCVIPAALLVPAGGRRVLSESQLGFQPSIEGVTYVLAQLDAGEEDGFVDALKTRPGLPGMKGLSFGRVPDGGDDTFVMTAATSGTANVVTLAKDVVMNEIQFHPAFVPPDAACTQNCSDLRQWIELHNRGSSPVDVSGWRLSKGVELLLPSPTAIPAGGYLVLASSRSTFLAEHAGIDPAKVIGDWQKDLAHDSDTINLLDALSNRVDHVKYGDGKPVNDLEPADGANDGTFLGSQWPSESDGTGRTLELRNPALDNRQGGAWAAGPAGGTPAARNSVYRASTAAVIDDVRHEPAVPRPTEDVTVRCRVSATQGITSVRALWHREGTPDAGAASLRDDGIAPDRAAGDGKYTGVIPAQPDRAIVGFQVEAVVSDAKVTTAPLPPENPPYPEFAGPYFLYQVLAALPPLNSSDNHYVIMSLADQAELESRPVLSNVLLPCTFIFVRGDGSAEVRYLAGIRYRGAQIRNEDRKSYRINFPSDQRVDDIQHLNLNATGIEDEFLASDLFRRAGMPTPRMWTVNLTFQGDMDPRYVTKEAMDGDFLNRALGGASDSGNLYRAIDPDDPDYPYEGDLEYLGDDPEVYRPYYEKHTNEEEDDYSDIIELCRAFDRGQTPDEVFPDLIETLIDTNQWARYLAIQSALSNVDGSIQNTIGEDYYLYRVPAGSGRPDRGKWILIPWDLNECFTDSGEPLFHTSIPSIRRFLTHPRFVHLYHANLINLRSGVFSRTEMRQQFSLVDFLFGASTTDALDAYITERIGFLDSAIPTELSAGAATASGIGNLVIRAGDTWRYWKGTENPAGGPLNWTQKGYSTAGWLEGPTGIGYGDGDDATILSDMEGSYSTVYARKTFNLSSPGSLSFLALQIDYDDGFVAYLNGFEVARRGVEADPVFFDAVSEQAREAGSFEVIDLRDHLSRLAAGENVLAIVVVNADRDSSDLSLIPELGTGGAVVAGAGCGSHLYAASDSLELSGRASALRARSVRLNGQLVPYDPRDATWSAWIDVPAGDSTVTVQSYETEDGSGQPFETLALTVTRLARPPVEVAGTVVGTSRWTAAAGPYLMTGTVQVPPGSKLEIGPGTLVIGHMGASILVRGEIQALGTAQAPIIFRSQGCSSRWGGIALDGTGLAAASVTHTLRYCDVELADPPSGFQGCVAAVGSKLLVEDSTFRQLTASAVDGTNARVEVRRSLFENIHEGVRSTGSTVIVLDSAFRGIVGDSDAIDLASNGTERSAIERCLMEDGSDDGIELSEVTVDVRDNVLRNITDEAISIEMDGSLGLPTVTGNLVVGSGTALALKSGVHVSEAHHNTFAGNLIGLNLSAGAGAADGGHGAFHSMIVWNNNADVKTDALSSAGFTYSNVSSGVLPGAGNISSDPAFVGVLEGNYALRSSSPCIGTGKDGTDMGAIPYTGGGETFIRGDADSSGSVNITDAIFALEFLFQGGKGPPCLDAADSNDDGAADISDAVYTLFFLFLGGDAPPLPYPAAGPDPTPDSLPCN